jgi:phosphatidylglycerophosphate synthase
VRVDLAIVLGILVVALASMAFYAITGRHHREDHLESGARGDFVLGSFTRSWFYWFIHPLLQLSLALGLSPLFYNIAGVVLGCAGGVAFALGNPVLGGWGVLLGGAADVLDGRVARAQGIASRRGAFLDSTLDRFAEVGAFVGLAVWFRQDVWALTAVVGGLGGSLLVSYARARGESVGILCKGGIMQRAERLLLVGLGGLFDPFVVAAFGEGKPGVLLLPVLVIIALGTAGTAVYRTVWIARRLPLIDPDDRTAK